MDGGVYDMVDRVMGWILVSWGGIWAFDRNGVAGWEVVCTLYALTSLKMYIFCLSTSLMLSLERRIYNLVYG